MDYQQYCQYYQKRFQEDILFACRFLELRGMKFLVHYGYENAVDLASEIMLKEMGDWK
jgi:hypothetical protein